MKTPALLSIMLACMFHITGYAGEHTGLGHGNYSPGRYDNTRVKRVPKLVQKRVVSREAIKKWVPAPGHEYINEKNPRPPQGQWVVTGYNVTYREVYDDGTSYTYTIAE